jgi:hypothetical protein
MDLAMPDLEGWDTTCQLRGPAATKDLLSRVISTPSLRHGSGKYVSKISRATWSAVDTTFASGLQPP